MKTATPEPKAVALPRNQGLGPVNPLFVDPSNPWGLSGFDGVTQQDMIIPAVALIQSTIRDEKISPNDYGKYIDRTTGEIKPTLKIIILNVTHGRVLWDANDLSAKSALCGSLDGIKPRTPGIKVDDYTIPKTCDLCLFSVRDQKTGKSPCRYSYYVICADFDTHEMFALRPAGASFKPFQLLINVIRKLRWATWAAPVTVSSHMEAGAEGKYYQMDFELGDILPNDELAFWHEVLGTIKGRTISDTTFEKSDEEMAEAPAEDKLF